MFSRKFRLTKNSIRTSISAEERLVITLRFLASGINYTCLEYTFRISNSRISGIVTETCEAIWELLQPIYLSVPNTPHEWTLIANRFMERWNMPNCLGKLFLNEFHKIYSTSYRYFSEIFEA